MDKWYLKYGFNHDLVLSVRLRIARNLVGFSFPNKMNEEEKFEVIQKISDCIFKSDFASDYTFVDVNRLKEYELFSLAHRHLISPEFAKNPSGRALIMKNDESLSIMINEEDHIRIQSVCSGLNFEDAYNEAVKIEKILEEKLDFAYDNNLGYLTECPSNLGTGIRASAMVHLPALESINALEKVFNNARKTGIAIRGTFGEGSKAKSSMYQISNQVTLGVSEYEIIENVKSVVKYLVEMEEDARNSFEKDYLRDLSCRALGVLKYSYLLSSDEMFDLLSKLRLGVSMKFIEIPITVINDIVFNNSSAAICCLKNEELDAKQRDKIRANNIRNLLKNY